MQENKDSSYDAEHQAIAAATAAINFVPSNEKMWELLQTLNDRLSLIEHRHSYIATAFPKNDLGKPDYDGHRKEHIQFQKQSEVVEGYQVDMTKKVLGWVATGVAALVGLGLIEWIRTHLK